MSTRKTRSDSKLDNLPPNQRETLERWLFDDSPRLSCADACSRLWQDFSVRSSETAVRAFYRRTDRSRKEEEALEGIVANAKSANRVLEKSEANAADYTKAVLTVLAGEALTRSMRGEELPLEEMATLSAMALGGLKEKREEKKLKLQEATLEFNREKWTEELKEDIDKGLDALMAEAKGNKEALELFQKFRAVVKHSCRAGTLPTAK